MDITLRTRTREHVVTFWERTRDEEIRSLFPTDVESLAEALRLYEESRTAGARSFGMVIYAGDQYIGDVWCYGIDETVEKMGMISFVIFEKERWGKGIAAAAVWAFIPELLSRYEIKRLGAFTYSANRRSVGLLRKLGFEEAEVFTEEGRESIYFEKRLSF